MRFFKDSGKISKFLVYLALVLLLAGTVLTLKGLFTSVRVATELQKQQALDRKARAVFEKKSLENDSLNQTQWEEFRKSNPNIPVPEVVQPMPAPNEREKQPTIIIVHEKARPQPTPTATTTPQVKTKTVIRYRAKPTPQPLKWPWSKSAR